VDEQVKREESPRDLLLLLLELRDNKLPIDSCSSDTSALELELEREQLLQSARKSSRWERLLGRDEGKRESWVKLDEEILNANSTDLVLVLVVLSS